jgi:hypothetical protein
MKTKLLLIAAFFGLTFSVTAQCSMYIYPSPGHIKITSNQTINGTGTVYWICSGLTVNVASSVGSVFLCEENVTININGSDGDEVYAKPGCIINNNSDETIGVTANTSTVTMNNNSTGSIVVTANCTVVTYDYSMVGGGGSCINSIGENELADVSVYPNPVQNGSAITISELNQSSNFEMYDVTGKIVFSAKGIIHSISTERMNPGYYFLTISTENSSRRIKIVVI